MKYYAVKKGKTPGVYTSWSECQFQTKGFSGAIFKSFPTLEQAKAFLQVQDKPAQFDRTFYTDGSYANGVSGGAAVDLKKVYYQKLDSKEHSNNRGELKGILLALHQCNQSESVLIRTDSQYCCNILQNGYETKENLDMIETIRTIWKEKNLSVFFEYVEAHVGIHYNEIADTYAGMSLLLPDTEIRIKDLT